MSRFPETPAAREAYGFISEIMLEAFRTAEWRETKDEMIVWRHVASKLSQAGALEMAHLLWAIAHSMDCELRPDDGSADIASRNSLKSLHKAAAGSDDPSPEPVQHPWGGAV